MTRLIPLKLARLKKGLSQWDVSKRTGVSQTMVSLYEREYLEPKSEHKEILAKLYGRRVRDFWK
jgi:transcriptional regulator with XRE-family HTH domain